MINQEGQNNGIRTHSEYLKSYSCESSKDGGGNGNDDTQVLIQRHYHSDDNYNIESLMIQFRNREVILNFSYKTI